MHRPAALSTTQYPARELPEASPGVGGFAVLLYRLAGGVHPLSRDAGIRHRDVQPLFFGSRYPLVPFLVDALAVGTDLRDLGADVPIDSPLPQPVVLLRVEASRDLGGDERLDLLDRMWPVDVVGDDVPDH